mmetsp:Transcript_96173/g.161682  ORF Transcript_96173/g.161682 Transcript_96173/m.161682 type:complete len:113 (+) Transcript_96173:946-1284(+)
MQRGICSHLKITEKSSHFFLAPCRFHEKFLSSASHTILLFWSYQGAQYQASTVIFVTAEGCFTYCLRFSPMWSHEQSPECCSAQQQATATNMSAANKLQDCKQNVEASWNWY